MDLINLISLVGGSFVQHLPQFLVIAMGLFFSFSNMKRSPKASKTALAGLLIILFVNIAGIFLPVLFTQMTLSMRDNLQTVGFINLAIGFVFSLAGAVGLGLLIYAVWVGRNAE